MIFRLWGSFFGTCNEKGKNLGHCSQKGFVNMLSSGRAALGKTGLFWSLRSGCQGSLQIIFRCCEVMYWGSPKANHSKASQLHFLHFPCVGVRACLQKLVGEICLIFRREIWKEILRDSFGHKIRIKKSGTFSEHSS